jgi:sigma-B regulation protein RsbU (phosphoserine phosphatase)
VLASVSVLCVGWLVAAGLLTAAALRLRAAEVRQDRVLVPAERASLQLLNAFVDQQTGLRGYLLTGQERFLRPYRSGSLEVAPALATLHAATDSIPGARGPLARVQDAHQIWQDYAREQLVRVHGGRRDDAVTVMASEATRGRFGALRSAVAELQQSIVLAQHDNQVEVVAWEHRLIGLLLITLAMLAFVVTVAVRGLLTVVIGPVRALAAAARAVADGDLSAPIPIDGAQEITAMGADVLAMRDRLLTNAQAAEQALEALRQRGPVVAALREELAPVTDEIEGLVVTGRSDPAEGVLGGDWYDVIAVSRHKAALILGDVAGHGPASAVFALRLKHALAAAVRAGASPATALAAATSSLHGIPDELFATVVVITVDTHSDQLVYANAGHPAALLLPGAAAGQRLPAQHGAGKAVRDQPVTGGLQPTGPLLSPLLAAASWTQAARPFAPGDTLLAFTDGLLEARDDSGEQFGVTGIQETLAQHDWSDGARLVDALAAAVLRRCPTRRDDLTVLHVHRGTASTVGPRPEFRLDLPAPRSTARH